MQLYESQPLSLDEAAGTLCTEVNVSIQINVIDVDEDISVLKTDSSCSKEADIHVQKVLTRSPGLITEQVLQSSSSEEINTQSSGYLYSPAGRLYTTKNLRGSIPSMTLEAVANLDKANVLDTNVMFIVSAIANALNIDIDDLIISKSAIRNAQEKVCKQEYEKMKKLFENTCMSYAIAHLAERIFFRMLTSNSNIRISYHRHKTIPNYRANFASSLLIT